MRDYHPPVFFSRGEREPFRESRIESALARERRTNPRKLIDGGRGWPVVKQPFNPNSIIWPPRRSRRRLENPTPEMNLADETARGTRKARITRADHVAKPRGLLNRAGCGGSSTEAKSLSLSLSLFPMFVNELFARGYNGRAGKRLNWRGRNVSHARSREIIADRRVLRASRHSLLLIRHFRDFRWTLRQLNLSADQRSLVDTPSSPRRDVLTRIVRAHRDESSILH